MKYFFALITMVISMLFTMASFAESSSFDDAKFEAGLKSGQSMLVAVHAPWCSTCRAQAPVLKEVLSKKEFQNVTAYYVDFDSQKEILKKLGVRRQSTLVVFKDGKEVGRSLGDTTTFGIESLLQKSL
jgi:thioredoxin 1